jgi:phosphatidylinositol alpha-mannosyltransferase
MKNYNAKLGGRIAESRAALAFQQQFFPGEFRLIPPGVDTERFRPGLPPVPGMREPGGPVVLFVGRLDARKGLPVLLRALARLRSRGSRARLVVVGAGPLLADYRQLAVELGIGDAVRFDGLVATELLPRYYASATVYCSPALGGEAYGIVLIEAMASGAPVVASDIPGYNEVVQDGVNGLLVRPADDAALGDAIGRLLDGPALRERLADAGRHRAETVAWPRVAQQVEQYYFDILRG